MERLAVQPQRLHLLRHGSHFHPDATDFGSIFELERRHARVGQLQEPGVQPLLFLVDERPLLLLPQHLFKARRLFFHAALRRYEEHDTTGALAAPRGTQVGAASALRSVALLLPPGLVHLAGAVFSGGATTAPVVQIPQARPLVKAGVLCVHSASAEACCPFCRGELEPLRTEAAAPPSTTEAPPRVDATEHQAEHARELPPDSLSRGERFYAALRQAKDGRALRGSMALWREMSPAFRRAWIAAAEAAAAGQAPADCYSAYLSARSGVAFDGTAAWAALPDQDAWIAAAAAVAPPADAAGEPGPDGQRGAAPMEVK